MALTDKQINELNIAYNRVEAAKAAGEDLSSYSTDVKNLEYAKTKGYAPPSVEATSPAPADRITPAAPMNNQPKQPVNNDQPAPAAAPKQTDKKSNMPVYSADEAQDKGMIDRNEKDYLDGKKTSDEMIKNKEIDNLVNSGRIFTETDAKNYAYFNNQKNWQQYIGGTAGQPNPLYISPNNWSRLQKQYTPYQLEQATMRTKDGIYWRSDVNIADIDRVDPQDRINSDTATISGLISDAKGEADITISDKAKNKKDEPDISTDVEENKNSIMGMLKGLYGNTAEDLYNELYNTPEIKDAEADVIKYQTELDKYDQQLEELKDDIRKEVEGEASESKITALAAIRGDKILKLKRSTQRDYDTALANYNSLKEEAANLLEVRNADNNTRYNRLFNMLQLQIQEQGAAFNRDVALTEIMMNLPQGQTLQLDNFTVTGIKETDDNMYGEMIDGSNNLYVYSYNKKTGERETTYIGKVRGTGGTTVNNSYQYQLGEYEAKKTLERTVEKDQKVASGEYGIAVDSDGNEFYYDKTAYDEAVTEWENKGSDWNPFTWQSDSSKPQQIDFEK